MIGDDLQDLRMTEVAFHFNAPDKLAYACRFARKALRQGARVTVLAPAGDLDALDKAMWNLAPTDFVAHCRAHADQELLQVSPVLLAEHTEGLPHYDLLLNLGLDIPAGYARFERVVEVVSAADESDRAAARQRWRHYASQGHAIVRHDLVLRSD